MNARDIMTPSPHCCAATDSIQAVAAAMRDGDCGAIPIVDGTKLVGIVTDRDLAVRALATGQGPQSAVAPFLTREPQCCDADADLSEVQRIMASGQVRRVPIVDANGRCIGIVSQADLARAAGSSDRVSEREVAIVVERISQPGDARKGSSANRDSRSDHIRPNTESRL